MKTRLAPTFVVMAFSVFDAQNHSGVLAATESATPGVASVVLPPQEETSGREADEISRPNIPKVFDAPFGSYPNLLEITEDERESFSPVVFFPTTITGETNSSQNKAKINNIAIKDHTQSSGELASVEDIQQKRIHRRKNLLQKILALIGSNSLLMDRRPWKDRWGIGKYDENRDGGMYNSDLFDDLDNTIDGYGGRRTVHLGMDLGGPVGTPVHAFCDGMVHSVGYNPERGDYGYVVVVEHRWGDETAPKICWALYGHLDESALTVNGVGRMTWVKKLLTKLLKTPKTMLKPGDAIQKGQVIGHMGDFDENGGWIHSHLHFQLSTKPPDQPHDMPGASSVKDRIEALQQYPDPRYVLGPMY